METQKENSNDKFEQRLTAVAAVITLIVVLINLHLSGYTITAILDSLKELAGLAVAIAIFLVANKIFGHKPKLNFKEIFEEHLKDWIKQNKYLVALEEEGKGQHGKRHCKMMLDHSNIVTQIKEATVATDRIERAAFVTLPYGERQEFEFRFNDKTFERVTHKKYLNENGSVNMKELLDQFAGRIQQDYGMLNITAKRTNNTTIVVSYDNMEQTNDTAKELINMVDSMKTMVLAIA